MAAAKVWEQGYMHGYPIDHLCWAVFPTSNSCPSTPLFLLQGGDFVPVVVGRSLLESLHHSEVFVKQWGAPLGNQYYRSFLPDVFITICSSCNKVSVALAFSQLCEKLDTGYTMWLWLGYLRNCSSLVASSPGSFPLSTRKSLGTRLLV